MSINVLNDSLGHLAEHSVIIWDINWEAGSVTVSLREGLPLDGAALDSSLVLASHSGSVGDVVVHKLTPLHQHQCVLLTFPGVVCVERTSHLSKVSPIQLN